MRFKNKPSDDFIIKIVRGFIGCIIVWDKQTGYLIFEKIGTKGFYRDVSRETAADYIKNA